MSVKSEAALQWFFFFPHFLIGLVNSRHTLEQPEAKQKKIPSCLQAISRV